MEAVSSACGCCPELELEGAEAFWLSFLLQTGTQRGPVGDAQRKRVLEPLVHCSRHTPIPAQTPGGAGWGAQSGTKLPAMPRGHQLQTRGIFLLVTHSQPHLSIIFLHKILLSLLTCLLL